MSAPIDDRREMGSASNLGGLRAWLGEIERTLRTRSRAGLLLAAVALGAAALALYLAVDTAQRSASSGELRGLRDRIETLHSQLSQAAQLGGRAFAASSMAQRASAEAAKLSAQIQRLPPRSSAATKPSHGAVGSTPPAAGAGRAASGAKKGSSAPGRVGATVSVTSVPRLGEVIVDSSGRTLYDFQRDRGSKSACYGACASIWPPLTTRGAPQASGGAVATKLGTTRRSDGTSQVTYDGHPLYTYVADRRPGEATGNGITEFGGSWHALHPTGNAVG